MFRMSALLLLVAVAITSQVEFVACQKTACKSIYDVLRTTPNLSGLLSLVNSVPEVKALLQDKNSKYTLIAPKNKASGLLTKKASKKAIALFLNRHIIKGTYSDFWAWSAATAKGVTRLAGKRLSISPKMEDVVKDGRIVDGGATVDLGTATNWNQVSIKYWGPVKPYYLESCKGIVYPVGTTFKD